MRTFQSKGSDGSLLLGRLSIQSKFTPNVSLAICLYIAKGSFELTVDGLTQVVHAGDTYYAAKNVMHGVVALEEDSVIIDTFTPPRADFVAAP